MPHSINHTSNHLHPTQELNPPNSPTTSFLQMGKLGENDPGILRMNGKDILIFMNLFEKFQSELPPGDAWKDPKKQIDFLVGNLKKKDLPKKLQEDFPDISGSPKQALKILLNPNYKEPVETTKKKLTELRSYLNSLITESKEESKNPWPIEENLSPQKPKKISPQEEAELGSMWQGKSKATEWEKLWKRLESLPTNQQKELENLGINDLLYELRASEPNLEDLEKFTGHLQRLTLSQLEQLTPHLQLLVGDLLKGVPVQQSAPVPELTLAQFQSMDANQIQELSWAQLHQLTEDPTSKTAVVELLASFLAQTNKELAVQREMLRTVLPLLPNDLHPAVIKQQLGSLLDSDDEESMGV